MKLFLASIVLLGLSVVASAQEVGVCPKIDEDRVATPADLEACRVLNAPKLTAEGYVQLPANIPVPEKAPADRPNQG